MRASHSEDLIANSVLGNLMQLFVVSVGLSVDHKVIKKYVAWLCWELKGSYTFFGINNSRIFHERFWYFFQCLFSQLSFDI